KKVFFETPDGTLRDAASGEPLAGSPPGDIDTVIVNNRLRNVLDAALGGLTLMAPNPGRRFDAARSVYRSRDEAALPALDKALEKETVPYVKTALEQARAAVVLYSADASPEDKIAAVAVIGAPGDRDALGL